MLEIVAVIGSDEGTNDEANPVTERSNVGQCEEYGVGLSSLYS